MSHKSWQKDVIPRLKIHGPEINRMGIEGDKLSTEIYMYYKMLYDSYDPITATEFEKRLEEWEAKHVR